MALMTVNDDDTNDPRSKPRWSAGKKLDVVLRLLRGEQLDALSRELGVEAHRRLAGRLPLRRQRGAQGPTGSADRGRPPAAGGRTQDRRADHGGRGVAPGSRKKGAAMPRRNGRDSRGGVLSGGHGVSHLARAPLDDLSPARHGRRAMSPRPRTDISDEQLLAAIRLVLELTVLRRGLPQGAGSLPA